MSAGNYTVRIQPIIDDKKLRDQLSEAGKKAGKTMGKAMSADMANGMKPVKGMIGELGSAMKRKLSYSAFTYATKAIKSMVSSVRELDKAQTQLSKVTDLQGKSMEEFTDKAFEAGKTVSRTGTEMVSAATLFAQAGMKDQALELGRVATMYQNIADEEVSINDATGMIVATMKAFDMSSVDDAMGIINVINEVSNNFAVSSSDLATNINKSTAAAKNAGMTYQELVTSMAGMIEITRSGSKASRAVVTLSSRYAQMTDEASSTGAKLTEFYDSLGIKTRDADGQLVDFYKVLEQMGEKWNDLDDDQKKYYANIQAGANQSQNLLALLNNWKNVGGKGGIMDTAMQSWDSDSAEKANENYMNSLEGKINGLKSAWQQLSRDFMNSGMLKGLITIATKILEIADHVGALGTIIGVVFAYRGLFALATFMETAGNLSNMLTMIGASASKMGKEVVTAFTGAEAGAVGTGAVMQATAGETGAVVATEAEVASDVVVAEATKAEAGVVASAETAGAAATQAGAEAEAAGIAGASGFSKFLAIAKFLAPALALVGLGVAAIEIDKYFSMESSMKRLDEYKEKAEEVQSKISALEKKKEESGLTKKEERELKLLQLQNKELERQIELEEKRAKKGAEKILKGGSGKAGGEKAGTENSAKYQTATDEYVNAEKELDKWTAKLEAAEKEKEEFEQGKRSSYSESAIKEAELAVEHYQNAMDKAGAKQAEYATKTYDQWKQIMDAGYDYASLVDEFGIDSKEVATYQAVRKAVATMTIDADKLKDSYGEVEGAVEGGFELFKGGITVDDVDLSNVEDAVGAVQELMDSSVQNQTIEIEAKDETGNVLGNIEAEVQDLTAEQWYAIIEAQETGDWSEIKKWENDPTLEGYVNFNANSKEVDGKKKELEKPLNPKVTFGYDRSSYNDVKNKENGLSGWKDFEVRFKSSNYANVKQQVDNIKNAKPKGSGQYSFNFATGKRKGQKGGLAWLGDEATNSSSPRPELVVTNDGAYLAGTTGWELHNISASDRVYSYSETKKLLGRGGNKLNANSMGLMPRYAKGKKSKKEKKREEFERKLATLDYKRERYHWSDEYYNKQYAKLAKKYKKYTTLSQKRDQKLSNSNMIHDNKMDSLQNATDAVADGRDLDLVLKNIDKARKARQISIKEQKELRANAYKSSIDYYTKEYLAGKKNYADLLKVTKAYWKEVGTYSKEYYESLDALREAEIEKVTKEQETYSDKLEYGKQYASLQIRELEKQKELRDKEKERIEDAEELVDLQNSLSEARAKMVRVYKEGVGWVYESDSKAVKDAQKDLDDYFEEHADDSLQAQIDKWQEIADLYDDIEAQSELFKLAQKLGVNNMYDLVKGDVTDVETMANWIKSQTTWVNALDAVITNLENMTGKEYRDAYLDTGVTQSAKNAQYNKYNYDNVFAGTRSTGNLSNSFGKTNSEYIEGIVKAVMTANEYVGLNKAEAKALAGDSIANTFNIDNISLPNVSDAKGFELSLRQWALQNSYTKA